MNPRYFRTPAAFRAWLVAHHATKSELWVGYHKKASGHPSITWPKSVDEALCFGWIDGIRKNVDEGRYTIRFTPRKSVSVWSAVNIRRVAVLTAEGRMTPAGLAAFAGRRENKSGIYSYEQRAADLVEPYAGLMRENISAWEFFQAQPPSYRKTACWWVVSAKKEETRRARLDKLMAHSAAGRTLPQYTRKKPAT
jgi:uncharacterized protein YdeI (YjbR/CyaY-like superfamily)